MRGAIRLGGGGAQLKESAGTTLTYLYLYMFYALSVVKMVSVHRLYKENVQTRRHKSSSLNFMSSFTIKFRYVKAQ
jgi:hypothetical protein